MDQTTKTAVNWKAFVYFSMIIINIICCHLSYTLSSLQ